MYQRRAEISPGPGRSLRKFALARAAADARGRLPECRVCERVQRLVELAELSREQNESLLLRCRPVETIELVSDPIEAFEQRVQLPVSDVPLFHASILRGALLKKLGATSDDDCVSPETFQEPVEGARASLYGGQTTPRSKLREGDSRQRLGRVGEHADLTTSGHQRPQSGARLGIPAHVHGGALLGESLEQDAPVATAPLIELRRRFASVERQSARFDAQKVRRRGEPLVPEPTGVAQRSIEVDRHRQGHDATRRARAARCQSRTPHATPTASIATSSGEPMRPGTNTWCSSSLTA